MAVHTKAKGKGNRGKEEEEEGRRKVVNLFELTSLKVCVWSTLKPPKCTMFGIGVMLARPATAPTGAGNSSIAPKGAREDIGKSFARNFSSVVVDTDNAVDIRPRCRQCVTCTPTCPVGCARRKRLYTSHAKHTNTFLSREESNFGDVLTSSKERVRLIGLKINHSAWFDDPRHCCRLSGTRAPTAKDSSFVPLNNDLVLRCSVT